MSPGRIRDRGSFFDCECRLADRGSFCGYVWVTCVFVCTCVRVSWEKYAGYSTLVSISGVCGGMARCGVTPDLSQLRSNKCN